MPPVKPIDFTAENVFPASRGVEPCPVLCRNFMQKLSEFAGEGRTVIQRFQQLETFIRELVEEPVLFLREGGLHFLRQGMDQVLFRNGHRDPGLVQPFINIVTLQ